MSAPSRANPRAIARPLPRPPPVTSAILPASFMSPLQTTEGTAQARTHSCGYNATESAEWQAARIRGDERVRKAEALPHRRGVQLNARVGTPPTPVVTADAGGQTTGRS